MQFGLRPLCAAALKDRGDDAADVHARAQLRELAGLAVELRALLVGGRRLCHHGRAVFRLDVSKLGPERVCF